MTVSPDKIAEWFFSASDMLFGILPNSQQPLTTTMEVANPADLEAATRALAVIEVAVIDTKEAAGTLLLDLAIVNPQRTKFLIMKLCAEIAATRVDRKKSVDFTLHGNEYRMDELERIEKRIRDDLDPRFQRARLWSATYGEILGVAASDDSWFDS